MGEGRTVASGCQATVSIERVSNSPAPHYLIVGIVGPQRWIRRILAIACPIVDETFTAQPRRSRMQSLRHTVYPVVGEAMGTVPVRQRGHVEDVIIRIREGAKSPARPVKADRIEGSVGSIGVRRRYTVWKR